MTPLIFLDCETTGLCPDIHAPWEIAWITAVHDDGELVIVDTYTQFVKLSHDQAMRADYDALEVGRFAERYTGQYHATSADVIDDLKTCITTVMEYASTHRLPHLVGAVPSFDHAMLCNNWLGWPGFGEGLWHYHLIDVEVLVAGKLGIAPPYNSSDLTNALGVTVDDEVRHTALGDVTWAMNLYAAVYGLTIKE